MLHEGWTRPPPLSRLQIVTLGSFNTILLIILAAVVMLARGTSPGVPQGMHPVLAAVVLLALWLLTSWTTARAITGYHRDPVDSWGSTWARGIGHGVMAGAIAIGGMFLLIIVLALLEDGFSGQAATAVSYAMLYVWTLGLVAALVIGGAAGFVVSTVDRLMLQFLARA